MSKFIASRLYGKFVPGALSGGTEIVFGITGFSVTGGERNMIDITTGADARRFSFPGLASPLTATINFIYQGDINRLDDALTYCEPGELFIQSAIDDGTCTLTDIIGTGGQTPVGLKVACTGYTIEAELDGAVTGTVTFERTAPIIVSP